MSCLAFSRTCVARHAPTDAKPLRPASKPVSVSMDALHSRKAVRSQFYSTSFLSQVKQRVSRPRRSQITATSDDSERDPEIFASDPVAGAFTRVDSEPDKRGYECSKTLAVILDANPYLSMGSRQVISAAAKMSNSLKTKLTVAMVDEEGSTVDLKVRADTMRFYMEENEHENYKLMNMKMKKDDKGTLVVSDLAEEMKSDIVFLSTDCVHDKKVDVNLLQEFILCPLMLVPDV